MTAPPAASIASPQSWNAYSYVMNNPLNLVDLYGLDCAYLNDAGTAANWIDHHSNIGECEQNGGYWANGTINQLSWVQPNVNNDTAVIYSQFENGGIGVSLASQTSTQGAFGLSDDATQSMASFQEWIPETSSQLAIQAIHDGLQYLPAVCSLGVSARIGGTAGVGAQLNTDLGKNTSLRASYRAQVAALGPVQGSISSDGTNFPAATISVRIPDTPVSVGVCTPDGNTISGVQAAVRLKKIFSLTANARLANAFGCPR